MKRAEYVVIAAYHGKPHIRIVDAIDADDAAEKFARHKPKDFEGLIYVTLLSNWTSEPGFEAQAVCQ